MRPSDRRPGLPNLHNERALISGIHAWASSAIAGEAMHAGEQAEVAQIDGAAALVLR
jgi:hypothetical protein